VKGRFFVKVEMLRTT